MIICNIIIQITYVNPYTLCCHMSHTGTGNATELELLS